MTTPSPRVYPFIPLLELDLCHIKTISNPYMGHIWVKDHPRCKNWTLDFSPRFYFPLSPRSYFQTGQRFLLPNHVTSGWMSPRSLFPTGQRFPIPKHITSGWMSPRSLFPPGQRYPIPLPVMTSLDQSEATIFPIRSYITTSVEQSGRR